MHRTITFLFLLFLVSACGASPTITSPTAEVPLNAATAHSPAPTVATATPASAGRIVFQSNREGYAALYMIDGDGANLHRITSPKDRAFHPAWSPDAKYLAFVTSDIRPNALIRITASGTEPVPLTQDKVTHFFPVWSPDSRYIALGTQNRQSQDLRVVRADGTGTTQIITATSNPKAGFSIPAWTPDAQSLLFTTIHKDHTEWYLSTLDGATRLWRRTTSKDLSPTWSPDGQYIAFASDRDAPGLPGNTAIFVMKADGTDIRRLTAPGQLDTEPSWSPDSMRLAFVSYRSGSSEIYSINRNGTDERRLTRDSADDYRPVWEPSTR